MTTAVVVAGLVTVVAGAVVVGLGVVVTGVVAGVVAGVVTGAVVVGLRVVGAIGAEVPVTVAVGTGVPVAAPPVVLPGAMGTLLKTVKRKEAPQNSLRFASHVIVHSLSPTLTASGLILSPHPTREHLLVSQKMGVKGRERAYSIHARFLCQR